MAKYYDPNRAFGRKVGRNEKCPCGSGEKFKRCHGLGEGISVAKVPKEAIFQQEIAKQKQRERQQGLGKPIIAETFKGERVVVVGATIFRSSKWKTFHDFLLQYLVHVLEPSWLKVESEKHENKQHPIVKLRRHVLSWFRAQKPKDSEIQTAPMTGAVLSILRFSYHLYLLNHNGGLPPALLARLKIFDQFEGAQHELYIAATLIKAGFKIEFEDEADRSASHCEFTVTHRTTKKSFSVEAKAQTKLSVSIRRPLGKALAKEAKFTRIIWIAINAPASNGVLAKDVLLNAMDELQKRESNPQEQVRNTPPAYVIVSNHPYSFAGDSIDFNESWFADGFKIPDFKVNQIFTSVREMKLCREKHQEIYDLLQSMERHREIPITFDGQASSLAFNQGPPRLQIGQIYNIPQEDGTVITAELKHAAVVVEKKAAMCVYWSEDAGNLMGWCALTHAEIEAYKQYPETFFGVYEPGEGGKNKDPLELFDWMHRSYSKTPKPRLIELMAECNFSEPNTNTLSQEELAIRFCERSVEAGYRIMNQPSDSVFQPVRDS